MFCFCRLIHDSEAFPLWTDALPCRRAASAQRDHAGPGFTIAHFPAAVNQKFRRASIERLSLSSEGAGGMRKSAVNYGKFRYRIKNLKMRAVKPAFFQKATEIWLTFLLLAWYTNVLICPAVSAHNSPIFSPVYHTGAGARKRQRLNFKPRTRVFVLLGRLPFCRICRKISGLGGTAAGYTRDNARLKK